MSKQTSGCYLPAGAGSLPYSYRLSWQPASTQAVAWHATVTDARIEFFLAGLIARPMAECALEDVVRALEVEIDRVSGAVPPPLRVAWTARQ